MLLEHGLLMQGYTVMRELLGSIGMLGLYGTKYDKSADSAQGRSLRSRFAETFVSMLNFDREKWTFVGDRVADHLTLIPWYDRLAADGNLDPLIAAARSLTKVRNGFDHAWTGTRMTEAPNALRSQGLASLAEIERVVRGVGTKLDE